MHYEEAGQADPRSVLLQRAVPVVQDSLVNISFSQAPGFSQVNEGFEQLNRRMHSFEQKVYDIQTGKAPVRISVEWGNGEVTTITQNLGSRGLQPLQLHLPAQLLPSVLILRLLTLPLSYPPLYLQQFPLEITPLTNEVFKIPLKTDFVKDLTHCSTCGENGTKVTVVLVITLWFSLTNIFRNGTLQTKSFMLEENESFVA